MKLVPKYQGEMKRPQIRSQFSYLFTLTIFILSLWSIYTQYSLFHHIHDCVTFRYDPFVHGIKEFQVCKNVSRGIVVNVSAVTLKIHENRSVYISIYVSYSIYAMTVCSSRSDDRTLFVLTLLHNVSFWRSCPFRHSHKPLLLPFPFSRVQCTETILWWGIEKEPENSLG